MSQEQRRSTYNLIIWGIVAILFIPIFFSNGGANTWGYDKYRRTIVAVIFGIGYILFFVMLFLTKTKGKGVKTYFFSSGTYQSLDSYRQFKSFLILYVDCSNHHLFSKAYLDE